MRHSLQDYWVEAFSIFSHIDIRGILIMLRKTGLVLAGILSLLSACTHQPPTRVTQWEPAPLLPIQPAFIRVTGHGTVRPDSGLTVSQMKLMAQRAARLDAYRLITEHVYGLKLVGNTTVADTVVKSDVVKSYVNGFIRGAREVSLLPVGNDDFTYEAIMEVKVDQAFFDYCYYNARQSYGGTGGMSNSSESGCPGNGSEAGCEPQDRYFYMSR